MFGYKWSESQLILKFLLVSIKKSFSGLKQSLVVYNIEVYKSFGYESVHRPQYQEIEIIDQSEH